MPTITARMPITSRTPLTNHDIAGLLLWEVHNFRQWLARWGADQENLTLIGTRTGKLAQDPGRLAASLAQFAGHPAYGLGEPRGDLERFAFLVGGSDGEPLFGP